MHSRIGGKLLTPLITGERVFLRDVIGLYMVELGKRDSRVVIVNADLMGTCRNRSFADRFPERSFNVGIAEQCLVSFAAGLAHEGFIPYVFSMAPFLSMRACEQVRTDVAYGNLNVRLIGVYAGCSGGISGVTHWGMEDCAIMGSMPNMTVMEPCDAEQARQMLDASLTHQGPIYLRCSVEPVCNVYKENFTYRLGHADLLRSGEDGAFLCSGITVRYALDAAERIHARSGKEIRVVDLHDFKPIDREAVVDAARTGVVVTAQDHSVNGGLGAAVGQIIAEEGMSVHYAVRGIPDRFMIMAHAPYIYHQIGLDTDGLEKAMTDLLLETERDSCG